MKRIFKTGLFSVALMLACSVFMMTSMCKDKESKPDAQPTSNTVIVTQPAKDATPTQPPAETTESSDKRDTATVYVLSNFNHYHRASCDRIRGKNTTSMSVTEAREHGYTPCPECNPMH